MARYTLPSGTTTETITFTPKGEGTSYPLEVAMSFGTTTHQITMSGFDTSVAIADGLDIVDVSGTLDKLTLNFVRPTNSQWNIRVNRQDLSGDHEFSIQKEAKEWILSVEIICGKNETGDPKIKVIRPNL